MAVALLCSRYQRHRTRLIKGFVLLYILFNTQVAFPRVLMGMADGHACTTPFVLRYINAQPLLTSCLTTMVSGTSLPDQLMSMLIEVIMRLMGQALPAPWAVACHAPVLTSAKHRWAGACVHQPLSRAVRHRDTRA